MEAFEYYVSPDRRSEEICYRLTDGSIQIEAGGRPIRQVALSEIARVELVQRRAESTCKLTLERGPAIHISSLTVTPDGEQVVQAADYTAWIDALHDRLAGTGARVRFRGQDRRPLWMGLFVLIACVLPPVSMFARAMGWGHYGGVVQHALFWIFLPLVAGGLLLGTAKVIRGLPHSYRPGLIPFELLPATGRYLADESAEIGASSRATKAPHQIQVGPIGGAKFERHSLFEPEEEDETIPL